MLEVPLAKTTHSIHTSVEYKLNNIKVLSRNSKPTWVYRLHLFQRAKSIWSLPWRVSWDRPSLVFSFAWVSFLGWLLSNSTPLFFQPEFFIFILVYWVFYLSKLHGPPWDCWCGWAIAGGCDFYFFSKTQLFLHTAPSFLADFLSLRSGWFYYFINYIRALSHGSYTSLLLSSSSPSTYACYSLFLQSRSLLPCYWFIFIASLLFFAATTVTFGSTRGPNFSSSYLSPRSTQLEDG